MRIVVYTPDEKTSVLVRDYRNPKRASEDFICSWFINRNEQMDWVCHSGQVKNDPIVRVCLMIGSKESIPDEAIEVLCQLLSRLLKKDPDAEIEFRNTPKRQESYSDRYLTKELAQAKARILANLKLMKVSLITL
jgi:hypothetical protein